VRRHRSPLAFSHRLVVVFAAAFCASSLAVGCRKKTVPVVKKGPTLPNVAAMAVKPNELGYIPIVMYHEVVSKTPSRDPGKMFRSISAFQKDLELMYAAGFRPVNLSDVVNDVIDVPAGTSPVVLTFDDGRESQFRLNETSDALKIDPNCAVGILQAFHETHPDWQMRATFFVLPKSSSTNDTFGQAGLGPQKIQYLLKEGMEIGNHSVHHKDMSRMTPAQLQAEIGGANNALLADAPGITLQVVALPMGKFPKNKADRKYLLAGTYQGKSYAYKAAIDASYRAIPSPAGRKFDPARLERIGARDDKWGVRWWINELTHSNAYPRYVSDGDPNVISFPRETEALADLPRLKTQQKIANAFGGAGSGSKPIVSASGVPQSGKSDEGAASVTERPPSAVPKPIVGG